MKLTDKITSISQRVLVYGGPKSGKTQLVGALAEHYKLIWIDCENGYVTLTKLPQDWQARIDLISIPDSRAFPIAAETLLKLIRGSECKICEQHGKVGCATCAKENKPITRVCLDETPADTIVVFDSLTQFSNSCISHITKNQPDDYKLDYADWGQLAVLVDKFLSQVQVARYNIVCITHEAEVELPDGKSKLVPVCGSTKSSRNTAKYFDHVIYAELKNKKHVVGSSTGYGINTLTGSRTDVILEGKTDASLLEIFTSWKNQSSGVHCTAHVEYAPETKIPATPETNESKSPSQIALEKLKGMKR